jgi:hypothetical protein
MITWSNMNMDTSRALVIWRNVLPELPWLALSVLVALLFGYAAAILPWWFIVGVSMMPILVIAGAAWQLATLIFGFVLVFEAIPGRFVPSAGSFRIYELIILYLGATVMLRSLLARTSVLQPMGPFRWALLYLLFCVMTSAVYVRFFAPNAFLVTELRGYVMWLSLPLLCIIIKGERERKAVAVFCIAAGAIVAFYTTIQSVFGIKILTDRVELLDTTDVDVVRSLAGGATYLMVLTLFWSINSLIQSSRVWLRLVQIVFGLVAGAGLAVSFGRGVWVASICGFLLAALINRGVRGMIVSAVLGAVSVAAVLSVLGLVQPRMTDAVIDRAMSTSTEFSSGGSFGWRITEMALAFEEIEERPLTGVGIGGDYKKRGSEIGGFDDETRYIHNAYVGYMVKMGVHAVLFQVAFVTMFFVIAWRKRRLVSRADMPLYSAVVGAFSVPVITSFTQPEWFTGAGISTFCLFAALMMKTGANPETAKLT